MARLSVYCIDATLSALSAYKMSLMPSTRKTVFVSYAHRDRRWADELLTFLAPWIRTKRVNLWDDSRIESGQDWRGEIQKAIDEGALVLTCGTL